MTDVYTAPSGLVVRRVSGSLFRSAQPRDLGDWQFIRDSLGVDTVLKLNAKEEGSDKGARSLGLTVHYLPIEPEDSGSIVDKVVAVFKKPDMSRVDEALEIMAAGNCLVHCTFGRDRTGLVVGLYRVRFDGWSTKQAWDEMIALGYHPELMGLDWAWFSESATGVYL